MLRNLITRKLTSEKSKIQGKSIKHNPQTSTVTIGEVIEISHEKLPLMPEKLAFVFHHNFYLRPKVDLDNAEITPEIRQKLTDLQQKYDIISKHSSYIGLKYLEEMKIDNDQNLAPVESKPYPSPLKHHKFEKIGNWKFIRGWIDWKIWDDLIYILRT